MATKKTPTKKAPAKKKAPVKKAAVRSTKAVASRSVLRRHVGLQPDETEFMTFRVTRQTVYWTVLGIVVITFTAWIMQLQSDIQTLYDQIDASTSETANM